MACRMKFSVLTCWTAICFAIFFFASLGTPRAQEERTCEIGAVVDDLGYCGLFIRYRKSDERAVDERISSRISKSSGGGPIRSFAIVVDVNLYPRFARQSDRFLASAKKDVEILIKFLEEQEFDEIIVLENENANKLNIDYFLDSYLMKQLDLYGARARFPFAFSGHGGPGSTGNVPGSLILANASGVTDYPNVYPLKVWRIRVTILLPSLAPAFPVEYFLRPTIAVTTRSIQISEGLTQSPRPRG
jgi:hypothetical protein